MFARDGGFGRNVPPHATSAAALAVYARNAILFDDADTPRPQRTIATLRTARSAPARSTAK